MANSSARKREEQEQRKNDPTYAQAHRVRRRTEPAAAPLETDTEAGGHSPGPVPPLEQRDPYIVNSHGEVRAGPGDAGRQDKPEVLDDPQNTASKSNRVFVIGAGLGVLLVVIVLFAL